MKQHNEFSQEHRQEQTAEQQAQQQSTRDFATPEELLRYDAAHTAVPPGVAERLGKSAEGIPRPSRPWWKKLWGGAGT